jgi:hypothetical protein
VRTPVHHTPFADEETDTSTSVVRAHTSPAQAQSAPLPFADEGSRSRINTFGCSPLATAARPRRFGRPTRAAVSSRFPVFSFRIRALPLEQSLLALFALGPDWLPPVQAFSLCGFPLRSGPSVRCHRSNYRTDSRLLYCEILSIVPICRSYCSSHGARSTDMPSVS